MIPPSRHLLVAAALLTALISLGAPRDAQAQFHVDVAAQAGAPLPDWLEAPSIGVGAALRAGYRIEAPIVHLSPEIFASYLHWFPEDGRATYDQFSVGGGLRLTPAPLVDSPFNVSAFIDLGYSHLDGLGSDYTIFEHGLSLHTGLMAGYQLENGLRFGAQVAYNVLFHADNPNPSLPDQTPWLTFGLHVGLILNE